MNKKACEAGYHGNMSWTGCYGNMCKVHAVLEVSMKGYHGLNFVFAFYRDLGA